MVASIKRPWLKEGVMMDTRGWAESGFIRYIFLKKTVEPKTRVTS